MADVELAPARAAVGPGDLHRAELPRARRRGRLHPARAPDRLRPVGRLADRRRRPPCRCRPNEPGLDWEGEVAAVVGAPLTDVDEATALAGVLGYAAFNDLTARTAQKLTAQWTLGKNGDRSGPMGPLVTADETGSPADGWRVRTRVNGETVQDGNTRDMIFGVGDLLSRISRTFTLQPGDVIATGTPEGVGYVRTPPWLLHPGDVVEVEIDHLGTIRTPVVGPEERP